MERKRRVFLSLFLALSCLASAAPADALPRTAGALCAYARAKVGMGYLYGAAGEICTPAVRRQRAEQYEDYAQLLLGPCERWDGLEVFDCAGLLEGFLSASEGLFPKEWRTNVEGAAARWCMESGPIETMPHEAGILLFQADDAGRFTHMGVYVGSGRCVHARGHLYGVVEDEMPYLWTHWGRASWLVYDQPAEAAEPFVPWLGAGSRARVTTRDGKSLRVYAHPIENGKNFTGITIKDGSELTIQAQVEGKPLWREIRAVERGGRERVGYVNAKDLSSYEEREEAP